MLSRLARIFKKTDPDFKIPLPDFKGQRRSPYDYSNLPAAKTTDEIRYRPGPLHAIHPRSIRIRTWLAFIGYVSWFVGVFAFISYRLAADDLETLEKEARQEIEMRKKIKKEFIEE